VHAVSSGLHSDGQCQFFDVVLLFGRERGCLRRVRAEIVHSPRTSAAASGLTIESRSGRWRIETRVMVVGGARLMMVEGEQELEVGLLFDHKIMADAVCLECGLLPLRHGEC
jgi:hypothetical protein